MIIKEQFETINRDISNAICNILNDIRNNNLSNYILYIAEGSYNENIKSDKLNPYIIDNRLDIYMDTTRLKYLFNFLNNFYKFENNILDDNKNRIYEELMIYCHIWESKPYLKKLYRFSELLDNKKDYIWNVLIPEMSKHNFIRNEIIKNFDANNPNFSEIIKNGFHSSLRNAFAHSDFSFETNGICLHNYKGDDSWELREITYDDWSKRFCYSILLCYHLLNETYKERKNIVNLTGRTEFEIKHPNREGSFNKQYILYHTETDAFTFKK